MNNMNDLITDTIQDCNINFLLGSGLSFPFLGTLGNIEVLLTEVEELDIEKDKKLLIRASLYKKYYDIAVSKNTEILGSNPSALEVLKSYCDFLKVINAILLRRKTTILSKEINLFTTNVDIFLEKALEDCNLEYNDGFNGRFCPTFDLSNFKKSHFKRSLQYDNASELPVFNLLKLHGSLSWEIHNDENDEKKICFSQDLALVKEIAEKIPVDGLLEISDDATIQDLAQATSSESINESIRSFMQIYEKLPIINPTKEKFKQTLLNQTHYELLRIYSNELEKENSVLFVMGFSFSDEHIREITLRAANSNPTLQIYIIAHSSQSRSKIEEKFKGSSIRNRNIEYISPPQVKSADGSSSVDKFTYNLTAINSEIFEKLFEKDGEETNLEELEAEDE